MSQSGGVGVAAYLVFTAVSSVVEQRVTGRLTVAAALSVQQTGQERTFVPSQDSLWCLSSCCSLGLTLGHHFHWEYDRNAGNESYVA